MTLNEVLRQELVRMLARNLDNAPAASEIQFSVSVYEDDLRHRGLDDDDAERVKAAFDSLGPTVTRFPTSADVIGALLPRGYLRIPGRKGNGFCDREGQKKFIDLARAALEGKTEDSDA